MQNTMDPRKQKRLGPAPIASFEKSFEDSTSAQIGLSGLSGTGSGVGVGVGVGNAGKSVTNVEAIDAGPITGGIHSQHHKIVEKMEPQAAATTSIGKATTTTNNTSPSSSGKDSTAPHNISTVCGNVESGSNTSSSASARTITKADGSTMKRPPPLKATTTNPATTTLVSSGEQQVVVVMNTFKGTTTLMTPSTPRIELSRASSSSHQEEDSRDSSPENVFEQVGTGTLQETIGVGFREDGALELRSSTEELYFMDPEQKKEEQEKLQQQQQQAKRTSPHIFKFDDHQQSYLQQHQRKDSASSEVAALLCISGRSSRISSVGSQGSAVSHLSAVSGVSRSPSPHRMLLETSFCGPKPLQNVVDGCAVTAVEPPTTELLEQMLLARKHDPTQVVLAEGIKVESSPKKKPTTLSNGDPALTAKIVAQNRPSTTKSSTMGAQRRSTKSPGQMVIGKTPSGTEYIRINLKPDHMYDDKGIASHERIVEAPNTLMPAYSRVQKKPGTLSIGNRNAAIDENRLTPTASPKPTRHGASGKETVGSRSPSPANISVSRKSSFSSLFRLGGKDSPDSPRERSRPRSKSKERQKPQSQNATPSKQKSVLGIFTTGKRGSTAGNDAKSSKSSSPIDGHEAQALHRSRQTPTPLGSASGSRPASRLRYYDEPVEGYIHIPLHTPPEEKETRQLLEGIQQLNAEPVRSTAAAPITPGQLAAAAAALKPVTARKSSGASAIPPPPPPPKPQQIEKLQRIENLDAIHPLPQDDDGNKDRSWSLEVNRHSSQDSQETVGSETSYASAIRVSARSQLANVKEHVVQENGVTIEEASAEVHRLPSVDSTTSACEAKIIETVATINATSVMVQQKDLATAAKEKRRLLFATRLGSGSQEQIFATQFSMSKTESQSSQLSEKMQSSEKTIFECSETEALQRQTTVIRRPEEDPPDKPTPKTQAKRLSAAELAAQRTKSMSTSEDEKTIIKTTTVAEVVMRRKGSKESKQSSEERRQKSLSNSEDDTGTGVSDQRHSRYLEHFDVRRKYEENVPRKPKRQNTTDSNKFDSDVEAIENEVTVQSTFVEERGRPTLPQPPPPSTAPSPSPPPMKPVVSSRSPTPPTSMTRSQSQSPVERSRQTPTKPPRTTTPTRRTQTTPPPELPVAATKSHAGSHKKPTQHERQSIHSTDEPVESSESERDSDLVASVASAAKRHHMPRHVGVIEDHESTGLVSQESFDDELPYIPTTLPEERAQGIPLIPMKERANMELKTCPVDRPRSTTPMNPSHLEEYCGIKTPQQECASEIIRSAPVRGEKLRISLPRKDSTKEKAPPSAKSPRRTSNASGKSWFEFAEEGLRATSGNLERRDSNKQLLKQQQSKTDGATVTTTTTTTTTTTHGRSSATKTITTSVQSTKAGTTTTTGSTQRKLSGHWIDFENIPEKRKPPKRITTLPKDSLASSTSRAHHGHHGGAHGHQHHQQTVHAGEHIVGTIGAAESDKLHYNYVKPEDCQCECHEAERESSGATTVAGTASSCGTTSGSKPGDNVDMLQQGEDMLPLLDPETHDGVEPSDSSREYSYYTDDEMDVPMRKASSSRSKSSSSKLDEFPRRDASPNPRSKKFPDNRK